MIHLHEDPMNMIICGVGGQGNILLSRMIGRILIRKDYRVEIGESFGAAQRGGSVFSSLRVSRKKNHGPLIPEGRAQVIVSLEPLEALRMLGFYGNPEVTTIFNTQPVYPVGVLSKRVKYPDLERLITAIAQLSQKSWSLNAMEMAMRLKAPIVANIIMLGALTGTGTVPINLDEVKAEVVSSLPPNRVELNLKALNMGYEAIG
jgi:indolepyruvate ferredoxin oxidoreductase, beta subunit